MSKTGSLNKPLPNEIDILVGKLEDLPLSKASSPRSKHIDLPSRRAAKFARDCGKSHRDELRWRKKEMWRQRDPTEVRPNFVTKYVDRQDRTPEVNALRIKQKARGAAKKGGQGGKYTWGSEVGDAEELFYAEREGSKRAVLAKLSGMEDPNDPNYGATLSLSEQLQGGEEEEEEEEEEYYEEEQGEQGEQGEEYAEGEVEEEEGYEEGEEEGEDYEQEEEQQGQQEETTIRAVPPTPATPGTLAGAAKEDAPTESFAEKVRRREAVPHRGDIVLGGPQEHAISGLNKTA